MSNKLLITLAAVIAAGFAALFGGLARPAPGLRRRALAGAQSVEDFKAGFALNASTALWSRTCRRRCGRTPPTSTRWMLLGLAYQQRARETGDPTYYTQVGRRAEPRALPRREGRACRERPRLARAVAPPLRPGARARPQGAGARPGHGQELRRDRRCPDRARPLPPRVPRLQHDEQAAPGSLLLRARLLRARADGPHRPARSRR